MANKEKSNETAINKIEVRPYQIAAIFEKLTWNNKRGKCIRNLGHKMVSINGVGKKQ